MLKVRPAVSEDKSEISRIDRLATADLRLVYHPLPKAIAAKELTQQLQQVVADIDGHLCGVASWYLSGDALEVLELAVDPSCRRQGVAKALLDYCARLPEAQAFGCIRLYTVKETGNVAIFERCGFRVVQDFPSDIFEGVATPKVIEVRMEKQLHGT